MPLTPKRRRAIIVFYSLLVLVIGLSVATTILWRRAHRLSTAGSDASQTEVRSLVKEVGKLIELPDGETPTLATVSDPDALKGQAFFAKAKKGDKVLIYTDAKLAILYDPAAKKIVTVAPISIGSPLSGQ